MIDTPITQRSEVNPLRKPMCCDITAALGKLPESKHSPLTSPQTNCMYVCCTQRTSIWNDRCRFSHKSRGSVSGWVDSVVLYVFSWSQFINPNSGSSPTFVSLLIQWELSPFLHGQMRELSLTIICPGMSTQNVGKKTWRFDINTSQNKLPISPEDPIWGACLHISIFTDLLTSTQQSNTVCHSLTTATSNICHS